MIKTFKTRKGLWSYSFWHNGTLHSDGSYETRDEAARYGRTNYLTLLRIDVISAL